MINNRPIIPRHFKKMQSARNMKNFLKMESNLLLFAIEGLLIALINNLIINNNYLFATRLGANDFQLSLVIALPQFVAALVLIPGGILTDRMSNKRRMVILSLTILCSLYAILGFVPMLGKSRLIAFLIILAMATAPMTMYTASWQAYFSDVIPIQHRNRTFTLRTRCTFFISIAAPLLTGLLLRSAVTNGAKLLLHQSFFWFSCILIIFQIIVLKRISGGNVEAYNSNFTLNDLKDAAANLIHNKSFLGFVGVALFFYITWQSDWTLYFIAQSQYLMLDEFLLAIVNVGGAFVQFFTIGFWSRVNEKYGVRFSIIMGSAGLCCFPIAVIIATNLPLSIGPWVFIVLSTLSNFAFATIMLNIMQCLLQVVPEKNKTLSISIYTLLIALSNAVMPMVGVKIYTVLGANLSALHITFYIIFVFRIIATGLWTLRWWLLRNTPK